MYPALMKYTVDKGPNTWRAIDGQRNSTFEIRTTRQQSRQAIDMVAMQVRDEDTLQLVQLQLAPKQPMLRAFPCIKQPKAMCGSGRDKAIEVTFRAFVGLPALVPKNVSFKAIPPI